MFLIGGVLRKLAWVASPFRSLQLRSSEFIASRTPEYERLAILAMISKSRVACPFGPNACIPAATYSSIDLQYSGRRGTLLERDY